MYMWSSGRDSLSQFVSSGLALAAWPVNPLLYQQRRKQRQLHVNREMVPTDTALGRAFHQPGCWPEQFVNHFELLLTHLIFLIQVILAFRQNQQLNSPALQGCLQQC